MWNVQIWKWKFDLLHTKQEVVELIGKFLFSRCLRYISSYYRFQLIIIYPGIRWFTWFLLVIKMIRSEFLKPSANCASVSYILAKYFIDISSCLSCLSSVMKLIFGNNGNLGLIHCLQNSRQFDRLLEKQKRAREKYTTYFYNKWKCWLVFKTNIFFF